MNYTYELWVTNALLHKIALVFSNCSLDVVQTKGVALFNQNNIDYMIVNKQTNQGLYLLATAETIHQRKEIELKQSKGEQP